MIYAYLFIVNAAGLLFMLVDKQKARKKQWRIPEATLLGIAAAGGSIGALFGMYLFHHKTKHPQFFLGLPAILFAQIILYMFLR